MPSTVGIVASAVVTSFTPTTIAGCTLWLDASDASSFTFSSGSVVSQWNDKSGNNRHASQGTVGNQPSRSGTINSLATVTFDGTNDALLTASAQFVNASTGAWTIFAVFKKSASVGEDTFIWAGGTVSNYAILRTSGTTAQAVGWTSTFKVDNGATISNGTAYVACATCDATTIETFVDNASGGGTSTGAALMTAARIAAIGSNTNLGDYMAGDLAEIVMYNTALSSTDRNTVHAYLKTKWGTA